MIVIGTADAPASERAERRARGSADPWLHMIVDPGFKYEANGFVMPPK
jgi:hypothetical protein